MNDDIFPVTPRITDPDLRPSQYGADRQYGHNSQSASSGSYNDNSLIEFEQTEQHPSGKPNSRGDGKPSSGFNILGFNLTYKHIIIIVLVVIALLIVIYLVVNWMRKSGAEKTCAAPPGMPPGAAHDGNMPPRAQPRAPTAPQRQHPDAGKSASELAALLQQSQNKLNELGAEDGQPAETDDTTTTEHPAPSQEPPVPAQAPQMELSTHMEISQDQIDSMLETGDEE